MNATSPYPAQPDRDAKARAVASRLADLRITSRSVPILNGTEHWTRATHPAAFPQTLHVDGKVGLYVADDEVVYEYVGHLPAWAHRDRTLARMVSDLFLHHA